MTSQAIKDAVKNVFKTTMELVINKTIEKENGKSEYQEVAKYQMPYPTLADFGIDAAVKQENGKAAVDEDGIPAYEEEHMDWLQYAIIQQLKAQNRNKIDGDGKLKDGMKFPTNFEELVAVGERSGEALKARHACRQAFAAYLKSKNKSDVVVKLLSDLLVDANSIQVAKDDFVTALTGHISAFVPQLSEADKVRFEKTLNKAAEAINSRNVTLDELK